MYTRHSRCNGVCRCPICLEQIKADLASLEVDVRMADGRDEAYRRRRVWVCQGDVDVK